MHCIGVLCLLNNKGQVHTRMSAYMCTYYWWWHWQTMCMSLRQVYVEAWRSLAVENLQQNNRAQCSSKLMNYLILQSLLPTSIMERISCPEILRKIEQLVLLFLFYPPQYFKYSPWQPRIRISGEGGKCVLVKIPTYDSIQQSLRTSGFCVCLKICLWRSSERLRTKVNQPSLSYVLCPTE